MRRQSRYNKNHKSDAKKERIIMIASSVFVLAALTMTGVYVKSNSEKNLNDGYHIDFSALEEEPEKLEVPEIDMTPDASGVTEMERSIADNTTDGADPILPINEDALDYMPMESVGSITIEIPGLTDKESLQEEVMPEEVLAETDTEVAETTTEAVTAVNPAFAEGERLVWPVTGNVLIPYSMDKTVYFFTLQQYKYNPAMIVAAAEGDSISAVMSGTVTEVFYDEEIGNGVRVDIGKGYEVTYGQLANISVEEGSHVEKGEVLGTVAAPTKYYSVEGTNAYFALTLDEVAVDPMGPLQ